MNEMREEFGTVCQGCGDIGRNWIMACDDMPEGWSCERCGRAVTAQGETDDEFRRRLQTMTWKEYSSYMMTEKKTSEELAEELIKVRRERDALLDCLRLNPNNCDYCRNRTIPERDEGCEYECEACTTPCPCWDCTAAGEHFVWIGTKENEKERE